MRYWIFGLFALLAACEMTPQQRANWEDLNCAQSITHGSISTSDNRQYVPLSQAQAWCRAMRQGQQYVPPVGPVTVAPKPPTYHCSKTGNITTCSPM